jgi:hypothetical protein
MFGTNAIIDHLMGFLSESLQKIFKAALFQDKSRYQRVLLVV